MIWQRTLASQMSDTTGTTLTLKMGAVATGSTPADCEFSASGTTITFAGYRQAYQETDDDAAEEEKEALLPELKVGDAVAIEYLQRDPGAMVLGKPVFGPEAPALRVNGRKVSNGWANLETLWMGVGDSLYGFRVYPIAPLAKIMRGNRFMRRFDFDPEAVVRLCWAGVRPLNIDAPVRYLSAEEGGVSHFKYLRDNTLLTWMHTRLFIGFVLRLPLLVWRRLFGSEH